MNKFTLVIVYSNAEDKILMCRRKKEPYAGLLNFIGGRIEDGESNLESAYRELAEETGIVKNQIKLHYLMTTYYALSDIELNVYVGKITEEVLLVEELNALQWIDEHSDFFDMTQFAGEGNIGHIIEQIKYYKIKNPKLIF